MSDDETNSSKGEEEFNKIKRELREDYNGYRNSLGVRLIGLFAALWTLLQTVQNSMLQKLSEIFPDLTIIHIEYTAFEISLITLSKFLLFATSVILLLFFIFRTFFRFSLQSSYITQLYWFEKNDTTQFVKEHQEELGTKHLFIRTHEAVGMRIAGLPKDKNYERMRLWKIPYDWFIPGVSWASQFWGHILCVSLAFISTAVFIFIIW